MLTLRSVKVAGNTWYTANKVDNRVPCTLLCVSCGFILFKQNINVLQLVGASESLGEGNLEMRKKAGLPRRQFVH